MLSAPHGAWWNSQQFGSHAAQAAVINACCIAGLMCAVLHAKSVPPEMRTVTAMSDIRQRSVCFLQVCNHPRLCYPDTEHFWGNDVVRTCGKMFWLDRMLVKLYTSGHRVLLFSTMTKMLDTVEFYLNWREVGAGFDVPRHTLLLIRQ